MASKLAALSITALLIAVTLSFVWPAQSQQADASWTCCTIVQYHEEPFADISTLDINWPSGSPDEGNLLLVIVLDDRNDGLTVGGFERIIGQDRTEFHAKIATSGEDGDVNLVNGNGTGDGVVWIMEINATNGWDGTEIIDCQDTMDPNDVCEAESSSFDLSTSATSITAPTVTSDDDNFIAIFAFAMQNTTGGSEAIDEGYTLHDTYSNTNDRSGGWGYLEFASAGSTSPTGSWTTARSQRAALIALFRFNAGSGGGQPATGPPDQPRVWMVIGMSLPDGVLPERGRPQQRRTAKRTAPRGRSG